MIYSGGGKGSSGMGFQFSSGIVHAGTKPDVVGEYELSGVKLRFCQGLEKGWSRGPFRKPTETLTRRQVGS